MHVNKFPTEVIENYQHRSYILSKSKWIYKTKKIGGSPETQTEITFATSLLFLHSTLVMKSPYLPRL